MVNRVGIVGLGYISAYHASAIRAVAPGAQILGVDRVRDIARSLAAQGVITAAVDSLEDLLAAGVDVVHVLTPPDQHADVIGRLVEARIPTLVEKPLCNDPSEAHRLTEAASDADVLLGVSHNQLFYAAWERAREMIRSGELGAIRSVDVNARRALPPLRSLDVRPWMLHAAENVLFEVAPHAFAQALDVVDEIDEVECVQLASWQDLPNGVRFPRRWDVLSRAPDDVVVRISLSYEDANPDNAISVQGTLGSVVVDFQLNTVAVRRRTHAAFDVEPLRQSVSAAMASLSGGFGRAASVVAGKAGSRSRTDPFTASINRSVATFYGAIGGTVDRRHSGVFSTRVVEFAQTVATASAAQLADARGSRAARSTGLVTSTETAPMPAMPEDTRTGNEVLVVGGTGFIGSEFVRHAARSHRVIVVARHPDRVADTFEGLNVEVVAGDLRQTDALVERVTPTTVVCQLFGGRGSTWQEFEESHVQPTIQLAEGSRDRGAARFLYVSSIALYDARGKGTITENTSHSAGMMRVVPYARAKAQVEERLMEMHRESGFPVVIARPGIVLGAASDPCHWGVAEWQHSNVCTYWGSGTNVLPLVLVEDVADALTAMCTVPGIEGSSYNLAAHADITAADYVAEMQRSTGRRISARDRSNVSRFAGEIAKWGVKRLRDSEVSFPSYANSAGRSFVSRIDSGRARRELAWQPVDDREELLKRGVAEPAIVWAR